MFWDMYVSYGIQSLRLEKRSMINTILRKLAEYGTVMIEYFVLEEADYTGHYAGLSA